MNIDTTRIVSIEWACLQGQRPRPAGCNARLGAHGSLVRLPILRLRTEDGSSGFGYCQVDRDDAARLLGRSLDEVFLGERGVAEPWLAFEYPLWDLVGQRSGRPVYALAASLAGLPAQMPLLVPCYDTSLYFDDLHLRSRQEAAQLLAAEAGEGYSRGHRACKIKIGRGARHLPLEEGTARDIAIIHAVREALGPAVTIMLDANNGYNLNLTKYVLAETADSHIFWIEEAFHEDPILYRELHGWLKERNLAILISDGEGHADPSLLDWARQGLVDVIQYDIFSHGFTRWLATGRLLDSWGIRCAPHHYGSHYGNYAACHLAGAIRGLLYVEWDEATTPGLDPSGYAITEGHVSVPNSPGFGLALDEGVFQQAVREGGYALSMP